MRPSIASMVCAVVLLTACSPANGPKSAEVPNQESNMQADEQLLPLPRKNPNDIEHGAKPHLIDPANRIWRFSNGVCRYLDRVTPPWRVAMDDGFTENPEEGIGQGINDLNMSFNASNSAFGVPVPDEPFEPNPTRNRWVIDMAIIDPRLLPDQSVRHAIMRDAIIDPLTQGKPSLYEEPYSPSFKSYELDIGGRTVLVDQELRAAVYCLTDRSWPNPTCEGVVLLSDQESATFRITLYALPKIEEIARSIHLLSASLRAECPARRQTLGDKP